MNETSGGNETARAASGEERPVGPVAASGDLPRTPVGGPPVMAQVREGMTVVDAAGEHVGTVAYVQMGEPEAATPQGSVATSEPLFQWSSVAGFSAEGEPDAPEPLRAQLLRVGFLKVHAPWLAADRYVRSDLVGSVDQDTVRLTVPKDELAKAA